MPKINGERLLADLRRIAEFGRYETGVHRPHLSPQDVESRHWLAGRMKEAGLEPVIDGIGTVLGSSTKPGPRVLIGSHSDTQPRGGWLDGVMGVIYGLEVARATAEDPETAHLAVDVASWADEEGHWGQMIGSRSFVGMLLGASDIDKARHRDEGTEMREALKAAGLERLPREHLEGHVSRLSRGAYRAGRGAGGDRQAYRHRHGYRRHLCLSADLQGHPEPRRHHADADPQGCRRRHDAALQRGDGDLSQAGRTEERLDRRQDVGRAGRARDHSRQGRDDPAVPRRRRGRSESLREGTAGDRRRAQTRRGRAGSTA